MFDILRLPSQDSHVEQFESLQSQSLQEGNERDASHWQSMAGMERRIAGNDPAEQGNDDRRGRR